MNIAFDVITVAILLGFCIGGYKRGIISMLLDLASSIAAFVAACFISFYLSEPVYNLFFKERITASIANALLSGKSISDFYNSLPGVLSGIIKNSSLSSEYIKNAGSECVSVIEATVAPVVQTLICIVLVLLLLVILTLILKPVQKLINGIFKLPVLGVINKTLGGLAGVAEGILFLIIVMVVIRIWLPYAPSLQGVFSAQHIDATYSFKYLYYNKITENICTFFTQLKFSGGLTLA